MRIHATCAARLPIILLIIAGGLCAPNVGVSMGCPKPLPAPDSLTKPAIAAALVDHNVTAAEIATIDQAYSTDLANPATADTAITTVTKFTQDAKASSFTVDKDAGKALAALTGLLPHYTKPRPARTTLNQCTTKPVTESPSTEIRFGGCIIANEVAGKKYVLMVAEGHTLGTFARLQKDAPIWALPGGVINNAANENCYTDLPPAAELIESNACGTQRNSGEEIGVSSNKEVAVTTEAFTDGQFRAYQCTAPMPQLPKIGERMQHQDEKGRPLVAAWIAIEDLPKLTKHNQGQKILDAVKLSQN